MPDEQSPLVFEVIEICAMSPHMEVRVLDEAKTAGKSCLPDVDEVVLCFLGHENAMC